MGDIFVAIALRFAAFPEGKGDGYLLLVKAYLIITLSISGARHDNHLFFVASIVCRGVLRCACYGLLFESGGRAIAPSREVLYAVIFGAPIPNINGCIGAGAHHIRGGIIAQRKLYGRPIGKAITSGDVIFTII